MVVVGISCGHDAAVSIIDDGRLICHLERERFQRVRHVGAMSAELIQTALDYTGISSDDIDLFCITTTQSTGYLTTNLDRLNFNYDWDTADLLGNNLFCKKSFDLLMKMNELRRQNEKIKHDFVYNCEDAYFPDEWVGEKSLAQFSEMTKRQITATLNQKAVKNAQIQPIKVKFLGNTYPGIAVKHQLSHAAAAFYQSPFDSSFVFSHDNGDTLTHDGYKGGMFFWGEGNDLTPIWTAPTNAGLVYSRLANLVGFDTFSGPGKLMGLAAYGTPDMFDQKFVGDAWSARNIVTSAALTEPEITAFLNKVSSIGFGGKPTKRMDWYSHMNLIKNILLKAEANGLNFTEDPFSDFGKAIAATAQKFFEENSLYALRALEKVAHSFGGQAHNLCMTGGAALNCPANTRIVNETQFENIFIPPSCDDGGLSIGAAMYGYHQVLQKPRSPQPDLSENIALNGRQFGAAEIKETVLKNKSVLEISDCANFASDVCKEIADDKVVAVMTGRSEIGPRALGNRSILADPRKADNWRRVNQIKDREHWRPFAPACLRENLSDYFDGGPPDSPHMLFNYNVKSTRIPAVTHVDKSARVQTVNKSNTSMRALLEEFDRQHDIPVLLNTSFNGRGEPIVERPDDAIEILKKGKIDAVFISNMKITLRR